MQSITAILISHLEMGYASILFNNFNVMKYSREKFEGYTHRFMVEFEIGEPHFSTLTFYSNSDSFPELREFINKNKSEKVLSFKIVYRASKEQDDMIEEVLKGL